jgi:hypothetical protein
MNRRNCDGDYIASNDDSYPRKSLVERMSEDGSDGTGNNQSSTVEIVRLRDECFSPTAWDGQRRGYYMKRPTGQSGNSAIHGSKRVLIVIGAAIACAIGFIFLRCSSAPTRSWTGRRTLPPLWNWTGNCPGGPSSTRRARGTVMPLWQTFLPSLSRESAWTGWMRRLLPLPLT